MDHLSTWLSPTIMLLLAAIGWWAPPLRRRRAMRRAAEDRLFGRPAVLDRNGEPIQPEVKSLFEELLERPALNGGWSELRSDVKHLKTWTVEHTDLHRREVSSD